jgi:monoamine oxidase
VGSYESTGIDVLIVGTGLAGLVAALECTRKGHNVRVLERNDTINTAGKFYVSHVSRGMLIHKQVICTSWASAQLGS